MGTPPETGQRLRQQAQEIRETASRNVVGPLEPALAPWQQILAVPLVVLVLGSSVVLLVAGDLRGRLLEGITASWFVSFEQPPQVYRLPPPPPRQPRTQVRFSAQPTLEPRPLVVPVGGSVLGSAPVETNSSTEFAPLQKNADWEAAFRVLQEESAGVAKLIAGTVSGLRFGGWEPLRVKASLYSIRLDMFRESEKRVVPFAWSVDVSTRRTRPENQEARDLFFKLRRQ